jgi:hypothetical protein
LDIAVAAPQQAGLDGDRLSLRGWAYGSTQEQAQALRQQCLGLVGNDDEPVVPVRCSWDSTFDGFYRVTRASAELDPADNAKFRIRYSIDCERVSAFAMPRVEVVLRGTTRSGSAASGVSPAYWHARPVSWDGYTTSSTGVTGFTSDLNQTDTLETVYYAQNAALSNATVTVTTTTSDYYAAAVSVYQGTSLYRVNGRQSYNYPTSWRLSNGLIRVSPASTTGHLFKISAYDYLAGSWGSDYDVELGYVTAGPTWNTYSCSEPYVLRVLRNSPEECVLRLQYQSTTNPSAGGDTDSQQVDVALRRGEQGARVTFRALPGATYSKQWGFMFRPLTTCVSTGYADYGIEFSSVDANGDKFWMVTATSCTMGTTNGRIYRNSAAASLDAMIGCRPVTDVNTGAAWQTRYYAAMNEVQRVTLP